MNFKTCCNHLILHTMVDVAADAVEAGEEAAGAGEEVVEAEEEAAEAGEEAVVGGEEAEEMPKKITMSWKMIWKSLSPTN